MLLIITALVLFTYTVVLIMFFMGWCALMPKIAHLRPEVVPFSVVKSPRRNSVFVEFESISSNSLQSLDYLHHKLSFTSSNTTLSPSPNNINQNGSVEKKSRSISTPSSLSPYLTDRRLSTTPPSTSSSTLTTNSNCSKNTKFFDSRNDYLHPKYSLPLIKVDVADKVLAYQHLLRTPVNLNRCLTKTRNKSFESTENENSEQNNNTKSSHLNVLNEFIV